jgi:hypothetical protein
LDKVRRTAGKLYLNGTVVIHPDNSGMTRRFGGSRNRTRRTYKLSFKAKNKLYDAITYQHFNAASSGGLYHCFLTLTFSSSSIPDNPNACVSEFCNRWGKQGAVSFTWVREIGGSGGLVHYHVTSVAPFREVSAINRTWCDCRGYYSPNAVRTGEKTGMVIRSLTKARKYVAKYMTKSSTDDQRLIKGRVYAVSNDLVFEPLSIDSGIATSLMHDRYRSTGWIHRGDFATIGQLKTDKAINTYFGWKDVYVREAESMRLKAESRAELGAARKRLVELKQSQLILAV